MGDDHRIRELMTDKPEDGELGCHRCGSRASCATTTSASCRSSTATGLSGR